MRENVESKEKNFSTKEIATLLDMGVTTVRKYAQYLEKAGYTFAKTKNNARIFNDKDIEKIKYLKELRENPAMTVEHATNIVMGKETQEILTISSSPQEQVALKKETLHESNDMDELRELLKKQNDLISHLIDKLDHQEKVINEWLNERDKDLMRTITEKLETQKLIAATIEEEPQKKSIFEKWLKK